MLRKIDSQLLYEAIAKEHYQRGFAPSWYEAKDSNPLLGLLLDKLSREFNMLFVRDVVQTGKLHEIVAGPFITFQFEEMGFHTGSKTIIIFYKTAIPFNHFTIRYNLDEALLQKVMPPPIEEKEALERQRKGALIDNMLADKVEKKLAERDNTMSIPPLGEDGTKDE